MKNRLWRARGIASAFLGLAGIAGATQAQSNIPTKLPCPPGQVYRDVTTTRTGGGGGNVNVNTPVITGGGGAGGSQTTVDRKVWCEPKSSPSPSPSPTSRPNR
jgi:hypothetical protein